MKDECLKILENVVLHNDVNSIKKSEKAVEYLRRTTDIKEPSKIVNDIIEKEGKSQSSQVEGIKKLITDNKFLDLKWEIQYDDLSSKVPNISQIKILLKIIYLNVPTMTKENLFLVLSESEFSEIYTELVSLQKNF